MRRASTGRGGRARCRRRSDARAPGSSTPRPRCSPRRATTGPAWPRSPAGPGYTTGAIYGRFTGKAELLLAAIEARSDDELDALFNEHRFEGKVTDILTTVGSHLVDRRAGPGRARCCSRRSWPPAATPRCAALLAGASLDLRGDRLAELVAEAPRPPAPSTPTLDTEAVVRFCHAVGFGFLLFDAVELDLPDRRRRGSS